MAASEPVEDAPEGVTLAVTYTNGLIETYWWEDLDLDDLHTEMDDAFTQGTFLHLDTGDAAVAIPVRNILKIVTRRGKDPEVHVGTLDDLV